MNLRHLLLRILVLALPWAWPAAALAASPSHTPAPVRIIVKWRDEAPGHPRHATAPRLKMLAGHGSRALERGWNIGGGLSVMQLSGRPSAHELDALLAALRADPEVEFAALDERVKAHAYTPDDPLFATDQWYLKDATPAAIRAHEAWQITRGGTSPADSTVIVAVLDTGVRFDHPDLAGKLLPGWDFVSTGWVGNDGDGWDPDASDPGDYMTAEDLARPEFADGDCGGGPTFDQPTASSWHGTRVAGMIAAASDNGIGIAGAGFHVKVLPVRVLGKCGGYVSDVIAGMYWAAGIAPPPPLLQSPLPPVNTTPARVINLSLGTDRPCTDELSEIYRVAVEKVTARGTLVVASAGNEGTAVGTPAGCPGVLAVAGVRHAGTKVGYSNLGPEVVVSAPAGNCVNVLEHEPCLFQLATTTNLGTMAPAENGYSTMTLQPTIGTSFSAPLVSGTAALMFAVNPGLAPDQVIELIRSTARPFPALSDSMPQPPVCESPAVKPLQNQECICTTAVCGAGLLDAGAAVLAARAAPSGPPPEGGWQDGGGGSDTPLVLVLGLLLVTLKRARAMRRTVSF